jgi:hypothetical protein
MKYLRIFLIFLSLIILNNITAIDAISAARTTSPAAAVTIPATLPAVSKTSKAVTPVVKANIPVISTMSGEITSNVSGKTVRGIYVNCKNITLDILNENGAKVGTAIASDAADGKSCRYSIIHETPRKFRVAAPAAWLDDQLQWQYYQSWQMGDENHNVTNIVLKSISATPKWRGIKGDITGSIAGYTPDQWFGGKDKIAIKIYNAENKLVDMAMSHQSYGSAPASYEYKVDNPAGYRLEAPAARKKLKFEWEYTEKSNVDGIRTVDIKLKKVNPLVVITEPASGSKIWLNQQVKISWQGPEEANTPVIIGYRWPSKLKSNYAVGTVVTLDTNPGTYTWDVTSHPYCCPLGIAIPMKINNNDSAYCSGSIVIRGGGYGNNQYWTWDAEIPVWFMTPYVWINNVASYSDHHAGEQLNVKFDKVGLSSPKLKLVLSNVNKSLYSNEWFTAGNDLTINLPAQKFPDRQFYLCAFANGEKKDYVAHSHCVLININQ